MFYSNFPVRPYYLKKEDIPDFLKRQKLMNVVMVVSMLVVLWILNMMVLPKLLSLYTDFGVQTPWLVNNMMNILAPMTALVILGSAWYLGRPVDMKMVEEKTAQYRQDELVRANMFSDIRIGIAVLIFMGVMVGLLVMSIVVPIYNLTSSIN